jgi:hypothetical protein
MAIVVVDNQVLLIYDITITYFMINNLSFDRFLAGIL